MESTRITEIHTSRCSRCGVLLRKSTRDHHCLQQLDSFRFAEFFWDEV
ncbi:MAG TPA: hypothetical protein VMT89_07610 [Candidatus Acidoferrales bacterium]|nr:hypothetical protein [Candidatus Acidoferrales bacterium]